jgi:hypothetical protein
MNIKVYKWRNIIESFIKIKSKIYVLKQAAYSGSELINEVDSLESCDKNKCG